MKKIALPASLLVSATETNLYGTIPTQFFYVPSGITSFVFGLNPRSGTSAGTLKNPSGSVVQSFSSASNQEYTITSPPEGVWKLDMASGYAANIFFIGIASLIWHDPDNLLKVAQP